MICLTDNDIIFKLAACDLLDDALSAFNLTRNDVRVLPDAKFRFLIAKRWKKAVERYGEPTAARIRDFLATVGEIDQRPPASELEVFKDIVDVDVGEAVLLCATRFYPGCFVATGDKRCLRALASRPECRSLAAELKGRIICLEQVILRLIDRHGFDRIRDKVVPALESDIDIALRSVFGSGQLTDELNAREGLSNYIKDLRQGELDLLVD